MKKLNFLFLLILIFGCKSNRTSIDLFFNALDKTLSKDQKKEISKCPDIGCLTLYIQTKGKESFSKAYDPLSENINNMLADSFKIDILYDRQRALSIAYQKKIKNQKIDFYEIKNEMIKYDQSEEGKYLQKEKEEITVQREIAKNNYEKFDIGDTLNLLYPLEKNGNHKDIYLNNFYYNKEYKDTLFLKCILTEKKKEDFEEYWAPGEFYFWLKILEARNSELNLVNRKYRKGNTISLPIYDYGRAIE